MKILLINPPWSIKPTNIWAKIGGVLPPLSLGYLASVLRGEGASVSILDMNALSIPLEKVRGQIESEDYDWIGITCTTNLAGNAYRIAAIAREARPEAKIIMGGVHPTVLPDEVMSDPNVDLVVRGEGERTVLELLQGKPLKDIQGISYRENDEVVHNPDRPFIANLDELPFPAYDLLPVREYVPALGGYKRLPAISVITSRGCSGSCIYCNNYYGHKVRKRSPDSIIEEIKLLIERYGIKEIYFFDDSFTEKEELVIELCRKMVEHKLDITWSCFARINLVSETMLRAMKQAGCHHVSYGIESGNEQILRSIKKPMKLDKIREVIAMTHRVGIETLLGFMFGLPGETEQTMQQTMRFAIELAPDMVIYDITTPFPGTELYKWAKEQGYLKTENWSDYDLYTPVMELPTVSEDQIMRYHSIAHRRFYLRASYLGRRLIKTRSYLDLKQNVIAFIAMLTR